MKLKIKFPAFLLLVWACLLSHAVGAEGDISDLIIPPKFSPNGRKVPLKRILSTEGIRELERLLAKHFDRDRLAEEFTVKKREQIKKDFSPEKMAETKKAAEQRFQYFKEGDVITVETRLRKYSGAFGGVAAGKIKIGNDYVPTIDIPEDILAKTDKDMMLSRQMEYINKNFTAPRKAALASIQPEKERYLASQKLRTTINLISEHKLLEKFPFKTRDENLVSKGFELLEDPTPATKGLPPRIRHTHTGIEMIYVGAGSCKVGSRSTGEIPFGEHPHKLVITKHFYIGKHEVTQGQWEKVMGTNPSFFRHAGADLPVENVSWDDCMEFCGKIGEGFRLPTEAEWEYAATGGALRSQHGPYGDGTKLEDVAWYEKNSNGKTHPVGLKAANVLGLFDMSGNVLEWCSDWSGRKYTGQPATDPVGPESGTHRVVRGGAWMLAYDFCQTSCRNEAKPDGRAKYLGFRLVFDPAALQ